MSVLIVLHNFTRWIVLILAVITLFRAYSGWFGKKPFTPQDRKFGVFFGSAMDVQLLLGIILWIFGEWGLKMVGTNNSQFFAIEHASTMILAVVLTHVGSIMAKRAPDATLKHRAGSIWYTISLLLVLSAIPWTIRPLLPGF